MANKVYRKVERCYKAGEVIFRQGDIPDGIYSVKSGRVSVYKAAPSPEGPMDSELAVLGPGAMFGEMGMLGQARRDASVKALEYTECLVITKDMFESQMSSLPPWVVNFIKILVGRLSSANERLVACQGILEAHGLSAEPPGATADDAAKPVAGAAKPGAEAAAPAGGGPAAAPPSPARGA